MGDIFHHRLAEISTNRSFRRLGGVGGAEKFANTLDGIFARKGEGNNGRGAHEGLDFGEERFRGDVGIVLAQQARIGAEHLTAANLKSGIFEAFKNLASLASGDAVGFQENQCRFHWGG